MARLRRIIERLLEQLAIPTEDGKLIYLNMLCMSWAAVFATGGILSATNEIPKLPVQTLE